MEDLSVEEKTFIHSHIKIFSMEQIEKMVLQNTSILESLKYQESNPSLWDDRDYVKTTTENGLIPIYKSYVEDLKNRVKNRVNK